MGNLFKKSAFISSLLILACSLDFVPPSMAEEAPAKAPTGSVEALINTFWEDESAVRKKVLEIQAHLVDDSPFGILSLFSTVMMAESLFGESDLTRIVAPGNAYAIDNLMVKTLWADSAVERIGAVLAMGLSGDVRAVTPLIDVLSADCACVRWFAAISLGAIGDARAVDPLVASLTDADARVRVAASIALGVIQSGRALDPLVEALGDADSHVREQAAWALGMLKLAGGIAPLEATLEDESHHVRKAARRGLDSIRGEAVEEDVDPWKALLEERIGL